MADGCPLGYCSLCNLDPGAASIPAQHVRPTPDPNYGMGVNSDVLSRLSSRVFLEAIYLYPESPDSATSRALVSYTIRLSPTLAHVYEAGGMYANTTNDYFFLYCLYLAG